MALKIATWNVNSVRLRQDLVRRLVAAEAPDVLCLQETKVRDELFPREAFVELGYRHMLIHGMKGYNGVAVLSRIPLERQGTRGWCEREDCRHAIAELPGGIELHNLYIPAGGDIPDPEQNDKFAHKLRFMDEMTEWFRAEASPGKKMVLVGDLNVAPLETDVWSHKQLLSVVSHTPIEVEKLGKLQATLGWIDTARHFVPPQERLYSWWSYRNRDWAASDRGRRLDHIWVTPPLGNSLAGTRILREVRGWDGPSDHVPVILELE